MSLNNYLSWTLQGLSSEWTYYNQLVDSISPTIDFMYNNLMTNPIFYWIIITVLVVSIFSFWKD